MCFSDFSDGSPARHDRDHQLYVRISPQGVHEVVRRAHGLATRKSWSLASVPLAAIDAVSVLAQECPICFDAIDGDDIAGCMPGCRTRQHGVSYFTNDNGVEMTGLFAHRSCILLTLQLSNDGHQFVFYEGPPQIFCEQCVFEDELKSWQRDLAHGCAGASIAWAAASDVGETLSSCWSEASQVILTSLRVAVRQPMEQDGLE